MTRNGIRFGRRGPILFVILGLAGLAGAYIDWILWPVYSGIVLTLLAAALLVIVVPLAVLGAAFHRRRVMLVGFTGIATAVGLLAGQVLGPSREPLVQLEGSMTLHLDAPLQGTATAPSSCTNVASETEFAISGDSNMQLDSAGEPFVTVFADAGDRWEALNDVPRASGVRLELWLTGRDVAEAGKPVASEFIATPESTVSATFSNGGGHIRFTGLVPREDGLEGAETASGTLEWTCEAALGGSLSRGTLAGWSGPPVAHGAGANDAGAAASASTASVSVHAVDDPDGTGPMPGVPAPDIRFSVWVQDEAEAIVDEAVLRSDTAGDAGTELSVPASGGLMLMGALDLAPRRSIRVLACTDTGTGTVVWTPDGAPDDVVTYVPVEPGHAYRCDWITTPQPTVIGIGAIVEPDAVWEWTKGYESVPGWTFLVTAPGADPRTQSVTTDATGAAIAAVWLEQGRTTASLTVTAEVPAAFHVVGGGCRRSPSGVSAESPGWAFPVSGDAVRQSVARGREYGCTFVLAPAGVFPPSTGAFDPPPDTSTSAGPSPGPGSPRASQVGVPPVGLVLAVVGLVFVLLGERALRRRHSRQTPYHARAARP